MSVLRFDPFKDEKGFGMKESLCGDYVSAKDYFDLNQALESELASLRDELSIAIKTKDMYLRATDSEKDKEIASLKAEIAKKDVALRLVPHIIDCLKFKDGKECSSCTKKIKTVEQALSPKEEK